MFAVPLLSVLLLLALVWGAESTVTFSTTYNEAEAFDLFKLNAVVYAKDPQSCLQALTNSADSWTVVRKEEANCNNLPNNACAFAVLKSDVRKQLVVLFRGTVGNEQLLTELFSLYPQEFRGLGFVHAYFKTAFETVWTPIDEALKQAETRDYAVVFSGFSLGGALATLGALRTVADGIRTSDQVFLSTFGEPRVGDSRLAASVDSRLQFAFRVVNKADLIPHVPFCASWGSRCFKLPFTAYHRQREIWYPNGFGSPFVTTTTSEDTRGSNSLVNGYTAADHLSYFNLDLAYFALQNCVA